MVLQHGKRHHGREVVVTYLSANNNTVTLNATAQAKLQR